MTFEIKDATPDHVPIILGLVGPSSSGKTFSALLLAHGIQDIVGGGIVGIDTEGRRMLRYADKGRFPDFSFKHMDLQPPFSSDRYSDAIKGAADSLGGKGTIIIDSQSHEHSGAGGYLEFHEAELDRLAGTDWKKRERVNFTAWIKPSAARMRLINTFLQSPLNFIFCFRAKEKLKIVSGGQPIPLGWQAIAGEEFVYEMIVRALLPPGSQGTPDWSEAAFAHGAAKRDAQDAHLFPVGKQISREMGRALAKEYGGIGPAKPRQAEGSADTKRRPRPLEDLQREGDEAAASGTNGLKAWFLLLPGNDKRLIESYKDSTLKAAAEAKDKADAASF